MTRKDYVRIAEILKTDDESQKNGWSYNIFEAFADMLEEDNERFDRNKFMKACGIES